MNGGSDSTTAIDAASGKAVATVSLGGAPEAGAGDGKGLVFINLEDKGEVVKLDSKGLKVLNHWSLAPCKTPTGMAMDALGAPAVRRVSQQSHGGHERRYRSSGHHHADRDRR